MQLKKLMASLGVILCFCTTSSTAVYAEATVPYVDSGISLMYEIADNPVSTLNITNGTAECISSVKGKGAVRITVVQTLQKYWGLWFWDSVDGAEWTRTVERNSISLTNSKSGLDSGKYRVKSVFTLTDQNGKSETITVCSSEQEAS